MPTQEVPPMIAIENIIYSDTVLPVKTSSNMVNGCCISNVSEHSLTNCIKTILKSNTNVSFEAIQYSKRDEKVYFYTDTPISTQAWNENHNGVCMPLNSNREILGELNKVFDEEKNKAEEYISLYDVAHLIQQYHSDYESMKKRYINHFNYMLKNDSYYSAVVIYGVDYCKKQLNMGFKLIFDNEHDYEEIIFSKRNHQLCVVKNMSHFCNEILMLMGKDLSSFYDAIMDFDNYKIQQSNGIKPLNFNFKVDISSQGVAVYYDNFKSDFEQNFKLSSVSYEVGYYCKCNSTDISNVISGREDEIFKRVYVKIDDCPEWSHQTLRLMRQIQIGEERKKDKIRQMKEKKSQKHLALKKKLLPWIKK